MKRLLVLVCAVTVLIAAGFAVSKSSAQMGLRENELFSAHQFAKAGPAIGSLAPELDLTDLKGKRVTLDSYRGQTVVLVKGGYT